MQERLTINPSIELIFARLPDEYAVVSNAKRLDMQELIDTMIKPERLETV